MGVTNTTIDLIAKPIITKSSFALDIGIETSFSHLPCPVTWIVISVMKYVGPTMGSPIFLTMTGLVWDV